MTTTITNDRDSCPPVAVLRDRWRKRSPPLTLACIYLARARRDYDTAAASFVREWASRRLAAKEPNDHAAHQLIRDVVAQWLYREPDPDAVAFFAAVRAELAKLPSLPPPRNDRETAAARMHDTQLSKLQYTGNNYAWNYAWNSARVVVWARQVYTIGEARPTLAGFDQAAARILFRILEIA